MTQIDASQIRDLIDKQAITEVLYRYCKAVDRHDRDLLASVYHPDAEDYHGIYNGPISGMLARGTGASAHYITTSHLVSNILIELAGDRAHVESYLTALHRVETDAGLRDDFLRCRYIDRFERREGIWRIARRVVVYDWGESRPAVEHAWWHEEKGDYIFGARGAKDVSFTERKANLGLPD